jgi:hypothetical protein
MAAIDLTSVNAFPHTHRVALSGTINTQQAFTIPARATQIQILFEVNAGKVITNGGADGVVLSTEHYIEIPAGSLYYHDLPRSKGEHTITVASATASTVVSLQIGERD